MATTKALVHDQLGHMLITIDSLTATAVDDVLVGTDPVTLIALDIDNTAGSTAAYVKIYDNADPTVGTTLPKFVLPIAGSVRRQYTFTDATVPGSPVTLSTACSVAATQEAGTGGTTSPASAVIVKLLLGA